MPLEGLASRIRSLVGWRRRLAAFAAGGTTAFAQAPFDFFVGCFIAFPVLVWLLDGVDGTDRSSVRRLVPAFTIGWWFGFGYFLFGLWWIGKALLVQADAFAWALPFAVLGLPALLAAFYGLAAVLARPLWSQGIGRIAGLAFAFGVVEWLRATILTGFPWNAIGYAAMPSVAAMQSAKIFGLFGMNALAVFVFALPALLGARLHVRVGAGAALVLIVFQLVYGYGQLASTNEAGKLLNVRIVQPSVRQSLKWDEGEQTRIFNALLDLSAGPPAQGAQRADVIIWPETAVPFLFEDRPDAPGKLAGVVDDGQILLTGAVRTEGYEENPATARYYNTVASIGSDGEITDTVDKIHLVPFGEYVPFHDLLSSIGIAEIVQSVGPFSKGGPRRPLLLRDGTKILPFICYEAIFPQYFGPAIVGQADLILNVTNDAWFGWSPGPYQHFRQARLRAVETGLPLIRAANNGVSAVVDAYGRFVDVMPLDAVGTLDVSVPLQRVTHSRWSNPGTNGPLIVLLFGGLAVLLRIRRQSPTI